MTSRSEDANRRCELARSRISTRCRSIRGLAELLPEAELSFDHPEPVGRRTGGGTARRGARAVHRAGAASRVVDRVGRVHRLPRPGAEREVLFRKPPAEVRTLALDEGSRTSAVLAQILLADMHGVRPRLEVAAGRRVAARFDGRRGAGDRRPGDSLARSTEFVRVLGPGRPVVPLDELPFVFAVWAARPGVDVTELEPALEAARDAGGAKLEPIAAEQAAALDLPHELVLTYLRDHLHFYLGAGERRGLDLYLPPRGGAWADSSIDLATAIR